MSDATTPTASAEDRLRELEAALVVRMESLEREQDQLRRKSRIALFGASALALLGVLLLAINLLPESRGVADVVRARSFVLEDAQGRARGIFEMTEDGASKLVMNDRAGRDRIRLALLPDGSPGISLADEQGRPRVAFGLLPDRTVNLVLADTRGRARIILGSGPEDEASLLLSDRGGVSRAILGVSGSGDPSFTLFESRAELPQPEPTDSVQ